MKLLLVDCSTGMIMRNYTVDYTTGTEEAAAFLSTYEFDACVVDTVRPAVVAALRAAARPVALVVVTPLQLPKPIARLLDAGADDVMRKPIDADELDARIKSVVRRRSGSLTAEMLIGETRIDLAAGNVHRRGSLVNLTRMEYQIVELLALRRGRVVSKESILQRVYGCDEPASDEIVEVYICKLRKKLGAGFIRTTWGRGYEIPA